MQTRLPRVPWWRPAALVAVAVPSIFFLTQEREAESRAEARPTTEETSEQIVRCQFIAQRVSRGDGRIVTMVFVSRADRASATSAHPPP